MNSPLDPVSKRSGLMLACSVAISLAWSVAISVAIPSVSLAESAMPGAKAAPKSESAAQKIAAVRLRKDSLESEIQLLNKINTCDGDGECEVIEMGARLCGGPSEYLVVSTSNPKFSAIKTKAAEHTAVEKELNQLDTPPDCGTAPREPYGKCVKNVCKPGTR